MGRRTIVIGGGQAGLSVSYDLLAAGVPHVVLERAAIAQAWRDRWDSFTLVTPNWTLDLPGSPYAGDDPEGHVSRDEIVAYLEAYAAHEAGEIREGVRVDALGPGGPRRFRLETSDGPMDADNVVVCTGAYQRPHRSSFAADLPADLLVIDATEYTNPGALPNGEVLVVGSGQTGVQLAEELHLAGRGVTLSCGRAPWAPRRLGDLDTVTWLVRAGFYDQPRSVLASPEARLIANVQMTGASGGHDLHFRVLQNMGLRLAGRLAGVTEHRAEFANDLGDSVAFGDARYADMRKLLADQLGAAGVAAELPDPAPFHYEPVLEANLHGFGTVIFTSGFRPDYTGWVRFPVFDEHGFPIVEDDLSTAVPGLYFCGVHFLRTRRSSLLFGVGLDAALLAKTLAEAVA
jgi:cation diffusion facilitator CzcD-associated flavoprotein CzcO